MNLLEIAPELRIPVFFFLGCKDHWVPPATSVRYFDALKAPTKKLVWFDSPGTSPTWTSRQPSTRRWAWCDRSHRWGSRPPGRFGHLEDQP
jgi:hypothetical protein